MTESGSPSGRFLRAGSAVLLYVVAVVVCLVALASFALSFNALTDLAAASRIPRAIAWAWPVVVDASIIIATFASLVLRGRSSRAVRVYPWVILIVFGAVSVAGNGYHALTGGAAPMPPVAFSVGAVPAIALLAATHLLVVMLTSPHLEATDEELVAAEARASRARAAAEKAGEAGAAVIAVKDAQSKSATADREAVAAWATAEKDRTGVWPSSAAAGDRLGLSKSAGHRFLKSLQAR